MTEIPPVVDPGGPAPTSVPRRRVHPALRLLLFLVVIAAGMFVAQLGWKTLGLPRPIVQGAVQPIAMLGLGFLAVVVGLVATWAPMRLLERRGFETVGIAPGRGALGATALGFLGGGLTPAIVALSFAATGVATITPASPELLRATLPMTIGFLFVSSWEEIALRGYFLQVIGEMAHPWVAAVASGLVFGLVHAGNPGANPAGLIFTGLNGILLAWLVIRTGSLWLACGYHAGWNIVAAVLFGMRDSGMAAVGALMDTALRGPEFLTGGAYGFEASWVTGGLEALVLAVLLAAGPRLAGDPAAREYYRGRRAPGPDAPLESPRFSPTI